MVGSWEDGRDGWCMLFTLRRYGMSIYVEELASTVLWP